MSITNKLTYLEQTKEGIKQAIINKGVSVSDSDTFRSYINKIDSITTGGGSSDCNVSTCWDSLGYTTDDISGLDVHIAKAQDIKDTWDTSKTTYEYPIDMVLFPNVDVSNLTIFKPNNTSSTNTTPCLFFPKLAFANLADCKNMFQGWKLINSLDTTLWDMSNVTDTQYMFYNCNVLDEIKGVEDWNVGNVTSMYHMFYYCTRLTSLDLSGWNVSSVTNMGNMFGYCTNLTSLNIVGWDASNVTNVGSMFSNCKSITSLDLSGWNTGAVTSMNNMFGYSNAITDIDITGWVTSKVTNMENIFNGCYGIIKVNGFLDLTSCDYGSSYSYFFGYGSLNIRKITFKNIGYKSGKTSIDFTRIPTWGINNDTVTDARQSLIDSLVTYTFDRATAGYSTHTITLSANTKAVLTEEEIAQITAKGYTIA